MIFSSAVSVGGLASITLPAACSLLFGGNRAVPVFNCLRGAGVSTGFHREHWNFFIVSIGTF